jgi:hypothetical protein
VIRLVEFDQGLIHDIPTLAELMDRIMREALEIIERRLPSFLK